MKKLKATIYFIIVLFNISFAQTKTKCEALPQSFSSFDDAKNKIENTNFKIRESVDTQKSSWIKGLSFFSCNGKEGFLKMKAGNKTYIHQNVPISIWNQLKNANSFGSFYNSHIKNRYRISIK